MAEHVSRETPPVPDQAQGVFSDQLPQAVAYADLLVDQGTLRGLIGPREVPRIWERHLLNCAVITDLIPESASVVDIGSGAGLPGIAIAIRRPDLRVTLVEPLLRRTTFLDEVVEELQLANVVVHRGRAEELRSGATYDVVTSRAVAPLPKLLGWSLPLCGPQGEILAMKGSNAATEIEQAGRELNKQKLSARIELVGGDWLETPVTVVRIRKARS
jgi:16S rRNA (guanine527-N7)-methyltransferase